jgi:hypothetical protein
MIAHLRRMQFGRKSEKIERQVKQLELELEDLESAKASRLEELERKLEPAQAAAVVAIRKYFYQRFAISRPRCDSTVAKLIEETIKIRLAIADLV